MKFIRRLFRLHHWRYTHRSGCERECRVCGTLESQYIAWVEPPIDPWWETTEEGDPEARPCGGRRVKPPRLGMA